MLKKLETLDPLVKLTNHQDKVVKIEIYVDAKQRCAIFDTFPDKSLDWREEAPHFILLNALANYQGEQLTHEKPLDAEAPYLIPDKADTLTALVKDLCHATAPLYALVNNPYLDNPTHPSYKDWLEYKSTQLATISEPSLKIQFLINQLETYKEIVCEKLQENSPHGTLGAFKTYHEQKIDHFIAQLEKLAKRVPTQDELETVFNHQDRMSLLDSLGGFLRSQAHTLTRSALTELDVISEAPIHQLFSFSAHPLRKHLATAKSSVEKQRASHAIRFINTRTPIPTGQLDVIKGDSTSDEKAWMDIMPYIKSLDSDEGLEDVDRILCVYANGLDQPLKKPRSLFYKMMMGEYGALGILGAIPLGLISLSLFAVSVSVAMAVDLFLFLLQAMLFLPMIPLLLLAAAIDISIQSVSLITEAAETNFSLLSMIVNNPLFPPKWLNQIFRDFSLVRKVKQFFLNTYSEYLPPGISEFSVEDGTSTTPYSKTALLNQIKKNQAEGVVNLVGTNIFSLATVAAFLHDQIKYAAYSMREIRKVLGVALDSFYHFITWSEGDFQQKQRKELIDTLKQMVDQHHEEEVAKLDDYLSSIKTSATSPDPSQTIQDKKLGSKLIREKNPLYFEDFPNQQNLKVDITSDASISLLKSDRYIPVNPYRWPPLTPWAARQYNTPIDFFSDIINEGLLSQLIDPTFEQNPGLAVPTFALSIICSSALVFPSMDTLLPQNFIKALQFLPQYLAKAFMGKTLTPGVSNIITNLFSVFLQWKLSYFGTEACIAFARGDMKTWIKKVFEKPEELTFGSVVFIAMGYGAGLVPLLPTTIPILDQHYDNPFLNAITTYGGDIYTFLTSSINAIIEESDEVTREASWAGALEQGFIGIKSAFLAYSLLSGDHHPSIKRVTLNVEQLYEDFQSVQTLYLNSTTPTEKERLISTVLEKHGITNHQSEIAGSLRSKLEAFVDLPKAKSKIKSQENSSYDTEVTCEIYSQEEDTLNEARENIEQLLKLILDIESLGIPINQHLDLKIKTNNIDYRSKADAEKIYDALYFAIETYNQCARNAGRYHQQIQADGHNLLHAFYNKHCYAGNNGLHKFIFGILLFPLTWLWRGAKYLIGTPSMRQQVKKSFSKDFAMVFQLLTDIGAPMLRSLIKAFLYTFRMLLGLPLIFPFIVTCIFLLPAIGFSLLFMPVIFLQALYRGIYANDARVFSQTIKTYWNKMSEGFSTIWRSLMCHPWVNQYIAFIAKVGTPIHAGGTGSPHRLNLIKTTGLGVVYEYFAREADTSSDNLQVTLVDLMHNLDKYKNSIQPSNETLKNYATETQEDRLPEWNTGVLERLAHVADVNPTFKNSSEYQGIFAELYSFEKLHQMLSPHQPASPLPSSTLVSEGLG
jgi:hypothetical protein